MKFPIKTRPNPYQCQYRAQNPGRAHDVQTDAPGGCVGVHLDGLKNRELVFGSRGDSWCGLQRYELSAQAREILDEELTDYGGGARRDCCDTRRTSPSCGPAFVSRARPILSSPQETGPSQQLPTSMMQTTWNCIEKPLQSSTSLKATVPLVRSSESP